MFRGPAGSAGGVEESRFGEHPVPENPLIWDLPPWLRSQLTCSLAEPATRGVFASQVLNDFRFLPQFSVAETVALFAIVSPDKGLLSSLVPGV